MATRAAKKFIGVYISPREICLAQAAASAAGRLETEHLVRIPTGFQPKTGLQRPLSLNGDFFSEKAPWLAPFQAAVKKVSWDASGAVVSLSPQFAILRYFVMPAVDKRFWNKSIPIESRKYIPVSFDEVVYDFTVSQLEDGKKLGILFGLTQKKSVEFILERLKAAQLELSAVEICPCSAERLFAFLDPQEHQSKGYIHFSAGVSHLLFSSGGLPVLYRETEHESAGGGAMTESRRLDVKGAVQFVERYGGGRGYSRLMLSGDGVEVWKQLAAQESPMPAAVWDPAGAAGLKDNSAPAFFASGASIRGSAEGRESLDISGLGASTRLEKQVQSYAWTVSSALGGLLLLLSVVAQARIMMMDSKLALLTAKLSSAAELKEESAGSISAKIEKMKTDVKALSALSARDGFIAPQLQAVADNIPRELWLTGISYTSPFVVSEIQSSETELRLSGETTLAGEMKSRIVEDFKKDLKAAPEMKVYSGQSGGMDLKLESESESFRSAYSLRAGDQKATGFTITCSVRRKN